MAPAPNNRLHLAELFVPEIKELLRDKQFQALKETFDALSVIDLADSWDRFSEKEQTLLFRLLSGRDASSLFQELEYEEQVLIINSLENDELKDLLDDFNPEEAARLFHELPAKTVRHLSSHLQKEQRRQVEEITRYPDESVGSWMRIPNTELHPNFTTAHALNLIRQSARLRRGIGPDGYYLTDPQKRPIGFVLLRELIAAPPELVLSKYMHSVKRFYLDANADQEEAAILFSKYKLAMAPVVDQNGVFAGYLQSEDIIPLLEEEATEDIAKMAGTGSDDLEFESIRHKIGIRFPWLLATCVGQVAVSLVIHRFDFVLLKVIALASFLPFINAMGGNVGSQTAMILVRALALREYDFSDRWKVLFRELSIGFLMGILYGLIIGIIAYGMYGLKFGILFPVVISLGAVVSMTIATLMGVAGPMTLIKFKVDPATATGPLITTITDLISTSVYFLLALWLLI